ncbi:MAG: hypothetical protein ABSG51_01605 [Terracidiphilus sp.]|jgi:hypothetical protein
MKDLLKFMGCWAAFLVATVAGGVLIHLLNLRLNIPGENTPQTIRTVAFVVGGGVLVVGLWPLARGLAGSIGARIAIVGVFVFLALGVNTILDSVIYTTMLDGAIPANVLMYGLQALLVGCALGFWFGRAEQADGFPRRNWMVWTGRAVIAWLAWPVIYLFFGSCIAPIMVPYYQNGSVTWLHLPPMSTIVMMQLVRSAIFLVASLPVIALWKRSRRGLWLALGLAHAVTVGIYGLAAATFLPAVMRVTHGVEITCDSFAYAGLLVLLFSAPEAKKAAAATARHDAPLPAL